MSDYYYRLFTQKRSFCKILLSGDFKNYNNRTEETVNADSAYFFRYVNTKDGSRQFPASVHYENVVANSGQEIVDLSATKFGSVYINQDLSSTTTDFAYLDSFSQISLKETEVSIVSKC